MVVLVPLVDGVGVERMCVRAPTVQSITVNTKFTVCI